MTTANNELVGDGDIPTAITDLRDIGRYMARIILDDRTLNKMVFTYNTVVTQNQIYDILEEISEEKINRNYVSCRTNPGDVGLRLISDFRSRRKWSTIGFSQPDSPVKHTPSTLSSSSPAISPNTSCHGVSAVTTPPTLPSTWVT